jgi:hypothetical protein
MRKGLRTVGLGFEQFEARLPMAADASFDISDDGWVTALDALMIINELNNNGPGLVQQEPNAAPIADDVSAEIFADERFTLNILASSRDPNGDYLISGGTTQGNQGGTVTAVASGVFSYAPPANFIGTDTFMYTVHDGKEGFDTALVSVTVKQRGVTPQQNSPPVVTNGTDRHFSVTGTTTVQIDVTDADQDPLFFTPAYPLPQGEGTISSDGRVTYTPPQTPGTYSLVVGVSDHKSASGAADTDIDAYVRMMFSVTTEGEGEGEGEDDDSSFQSFVDASIIKKRRHG